MSLVFSQSQIDVHINIVHTFYTDDSHKLLLLFIDKKDNKCEA